MNGRIWALDAPWIRIRFALEEQWGWKYQKVTACIVFLFLWKSVISSLRKRVKTKYEQKVFSEADVWCWSVFLFNCISYILNQITLNTETLPVELGHIRHTNALLSFKLSCSLDTKRVAKGCCDINSNILFQKVSFSVYPSRCLRLLGILFKFRNQGLQLTQK